MNNKQKHLEFIQIIINRMAGNLFFLKGWTITLIAALFALFAQNSNHLYIWVAYFPAVICWILDGYFLSQERLYRALYDQVRKKKESDIDFSMNTSQFKKDENTHWLSCMFSSTLLIFYLPLILIMISLTLILY